MTFKSFDGCIECMFLTDACLLDNLAGNRLYLAGNNWGGELGCNTSGAGTHTGTLGETITGGTNWTDLRVACRMTLGLKSDGTLWSWGYGEQGVLGDNTTINKSSPVQVLGGGSWKRIATNVGISFSSGFHPLAGGIKNDGTLWTWGSNRDLALGLGLSSTEHRSTPTAIAGNNWVEISLSGSHGGAIKSDGTIWTWGTNTVGQLGNNTVSSTSAPVQVTIPSNLRWKAVSVGGSSSAAIRSDDTLWVWGSGAGGNLGHGLTVGRCSPVQTVSGGSDWRHVSVGVNHMVATKKDNSLWTWGNNACGQLGDGSTVNKCSPVQVGTGKNWRCVVGDACGNTAIKTDGTLWTWGINDWDQTSADCKSSPVQIGSSCWIRTSASPGTRIGGIIGR